MGTGQLVGRVIQETRSAPGEPFRHRVLIGGRAGRGCVSKHGGGKRRIARGTAGPLFGEQFRRFPDPPHPGQNAAAQMLGLGPVQPLCRTGHGPLEQDEGPGWLPGRSGRSSGGQESTSPVRCLGRQLCCTFHHCSRGRKPATGSR